MIRPMNLHGAGRERGFILFGPRRNGQKTGRPDSLRANIAEIKKLTPPLLSEVVPPSAYGEIAMDAPPSALGGDGDGI